MTTLVIAPAGRHAAPRELALARQVPAVLHTTRWVLTAVALLAGWVVLLATVVSGAEEARSQRVLYAQLRQQLAEATAPVSAPIAVGAPVALLSVPRLGLDRAVIVQGVASPQLTAGPGHRPDTVLPGQAGVSVVYGRALSYGGPFAHLTSLGKGDVVDVVTGQGRFRYTVQGVRRAGDAIAPLASGTGRLTFVSAEGSRWSVRSTVYVDALLTKAAPAGRVAPARRAEAPMRGDSGGLFRLVLWLEALLALALAVVWGARRWGGRQAWTVGGVALLATLWGASESAWALLPNLL